uniref:Putative ovule protein n=1 Tax=Solanum chacoense TaxID=4108 RepID=A0A0V0GPW4_SOLCH
MVYIMFPQLKSRGYKSIGDFAHVISGCGSSGGAETILEWVVQIRKVTAWVHRKVSSLGDAFFTIPISTNNED